MDLDFETEFFICKNGNKKCQEIGLMSALLSKLKPKVLEFHGLSFDFASPGFSQVRTLFITNRDNFNLEFFPELEALKLKVVSEHQLEQFYNLRIRNLSFSFNIKNAMKDSSRLFTWFEKRFRPLAE